MEKRKAHYQLILIKNALKDGKYHITASAIKKAFEDFQLLTEGIVDQVLALETSDLCKSMTSKFDNTLWQDVYHLKIGEKDAYIKLQILNDETIVISFKEK